uniref:Uncharacterized protein n=1 Tax=Arundo donax TaxID=35708 RepID=A0A0A9A8A7_ARUDO
MVFSSFFPTVSNLSTKKMASITKSSKEFLQKNTHQKLFCCNNETYTKYQTIN